MTYVYWFKSTYLNFCLKKKVNIYFIFDCNGVQDTNQVSGLYLYTNNGSLVHPLISTTKWKKSSWTF